MVVMENRDRWVMHWDEVAVFDRNAASIGFNEMDMMRSAGESLAEEAASMAGGGDVLFLCGPGNNGGDGFVASCSDSLSGSRVSVISSHESSKTTCSSEARELARKSVDFHQWPSIPDGSWSLVVDCLLGAGASGPGASLRSPISDIVGWAQNLVAPVLACDIPTGLGGPDCLVAEKTVTFHSLKSGMDSIECGEVVVSELPWSENVQYCGIGDACRYPPLVRNSRKGDRGRVLVIGGGPFHGAPILAGLAAARSGCDLVHVAMPAAAIGRSSWPSSLIPEELPDVDYLTTNSIEALVGFFDSGRAPDSVVLGPGLGREEQTVRAVQGIIEIASSRGTKVVIDADAIACLPSGQWPHRLTGVLTPHIGEAERWLDGHSPEDALSKCKGEDQAIVVTGPTDTLTGPEGRRALAQGGHPRMAVGGTGDILAGIIGGLMAQGMLPWPSARLGCALLREAGRRAAEEKGPGTLAEDVPVHIAHTLADWTR